MKKGKEGGRNNIPRYGSAGFWGLRIRCVFMCVWLRMNGLLNTISGMRETPCFVVRGSLEMVGYPPQLYHIPFQAAGCSTDQHLLPPPPHFLCFTSFTSGTRGTTSRPRT